jgi:hypothetical protein
MDKSELSHPQGQITVRMRLVAIYEHTPRAVHRLDGIFDIINSGSIHILPIIFPVTGSFPEGAV